MANFITNDDDKDLKKRLIELVENSSEMKFLVGFFYFSGIRELYKGLIANNQATLKILVGLNIDQSNLRLVEYAEENEELSGEEIAESFFGDIKKSLTHDDFDTKEFYEQVKFFISLINENRLTIRKTYKPNHSKLYLFHLPGQIVRDRVFITGSSNLTRVALTTQSEFNVEISDYGTKEAEEYFDALWEDAVKITENDVLKKKLTSIVENDTLVKQVTPFEAYALIMKTYLDSFEQKDLGQTVIDLLEKNGYKKFEYQLDAVKQSLAIIEKQNGVIIADVVGLGKTIIACCVAKALKKRGIVICPPGLMGDKNKIAGWGMYLDQFQLYDWDVRSCGDLEETAKYVNFRNDIEVIVIDEVHRFRNQDTKDYEFLKNICRDKIVILLTATPFNNRPGDILSLLKLFIDPKKSTITLENDLAAMFRAYKGIFERLSYIKKYHNSPNREKRDKAQGYYEVFFEEKEIDLKKVKQRSRFLADQIRNVIEPVTIRRNRLDLKNNPFYKDEVKELSVIADPEEWFFELSKEQSVFYDKIIKDYFGEQGKFKGAIYRPFAYETETDPVELDEKGNFEFVQQEQLFDFMRRLMVKRFESSFGAFEQSIRRFKRITENAQEFIKKTNKYILDRALLEKIYSLDEDQIEEELADFAEILKRGDFPKNNRIYELDKFADKKGFLSDIQSDLKLFEQILDELEKMDLVNDDPKAKCLVEHITEVINRKPLAGEPKRKVIIFSEYMDTVKHLSKSLKTAFGNRVLVEDGGLSTAKIKEINRDFDASNNEPTNLYDVLLSTDRISEGFNLNRAGMIINYDIPWNPVRVIQRVGRINRISKKVFKELYIVNFFPTEKGAELVQSREIASNKMFLIHEILGEDAKIFDIDETPTPAGLFKRVIQNPDEAEEESFYTKVLKKYLAIKKDEPELIEKLQEFPVRVKVAKQGNENELLVFFKKGRMYVQGIHYDKADDGNPYTTSLEDVFDRIECEKVEPKLELSKDFWKAYGNVKEYRETYLEYAGSKSQESKAINNLKTMVKKPWEELKPYLPFIRVLLDDAVNYGSLSDYTLRRIANLETVSPGKHKETVEAIDTLMNELGVGYLTRQKNKGANQRKEIIIAMENQKNG
ncbi:MAG: phospholipase D-like domain-containing protein [Bacteroidetes bacterium]|uniref:RNA polymerase-associated protein RapA n=1 Tax=bioreactor metagenome TaxID=1076179 RepID=A0A644WDE4_9ZZZZ|nr:phospholipase D-like domain-containing protein [Bacteroidota bacterium]